MIYFVCAVAALATVAGCVFGGMAVCGITAFAASQGVKLKAAFGRRNRPTGEEPMS